jgi:hypothetical protein
VSDKAIERLVAGGLVPMRQIVPKAPWEIQRSDLDSNKVRRVFDRLRRTGKLQLAGGGLEGQSALFVENTGDDNARHCE